MSRKNTLSRLKTKERETRKSLIVEAAERVYAIKPYNKVSMREIAYEAGIATSSIYTYFPNQEALFVEATLKEANKLIDEMNNSIKDRPDEEVVEKVINGFIDFISKNDSFFRMMVLFMTQGALSDESLMKLNTAMRRGLDVFDNLFHNIEYDGNIRLFSHLAFASLNGILVTFRKLPGRSEEEIISHMKEVGRIFGTMILNMKKKSAV